MKLLKLLDKRLILTHKDIPSKKALLHKLSSVFASVTSVDCQARLFDAFIERENLGSTALGHGVAIPHIRSDLFCQPLFSVIKLDNRIDYGAEDHRDVDIIFSLIAPEKNSNEHLILLSECSKLLSSSTFRQQLRATCTADEIIQLITSTIENVEPA